MDLFDALTERMGSRDVVTELFQEAITALQNTLDEFSAVNARDNFHSRQSRTGPGDVRAQQLGVIGKNAAGVAPARDADVKLFLMDGGQRTRRSHDQYFIHGLALGGV
jgi:hypothetical protein